MKHKYLIGLLLLMGLCDTRMHAATQINTPSVSGIWDLEGSPYYIHNNITIPFDSMLTIRPGVQVVFLGHFELRCYGNMSAIGTPEQKIIFRSNDTTGWSNLQSTAGGWKGMVLANYTQFSYPAPTFEYCIFKDMKQYQGYGLFAGSLPFLYINQCEFYHNLTDGTMITLNNNAPSNKLKFTHCTIRDNIAGIGMYISYTDSAFVLDNKFYNNTATFGFGLFASTSMNSMSDNFLLFDGNELYQNTTSELGGGIVNTLQGGIARVSNNYIHHNTTQKNGAIFLQSKSSVVENNLVINNNQVLDGAFCGINDGGAGIQLLGQNLDSETPGRNIHIVRNNIVANNHSAITGAGIWVQHCDATVVNNTFINNTSKGLGAAVRGWGAYCKLKMYNNIIFGNKLIDAPNDTVYNNFHCVANLLDISNNLIDYRPDLNMIAQTAQGLATNIYDHNLALMAPTAGPGVAYDATNANFSPTAAATNCINQGNTNAPHHGTIDFYGNERVIGGNIDIGAVEFKGNITGIRDKEIRENIVVFPNPSTGDLTIRHQSAQVINKITLMDLSGRILQTFTTAKSGESNIRIGRYPDATYLLAIETDEQIIYKKFILKR